MDEQYVVKLDRRDGHEPETIFGPACLKHCAAFVKGWYEAFNLESLESVPEMALFRLYVEEVVL